MENFIIVIFCFFVLFGAYGALADGGGGGGGAEFDGEKAEQALLERINQERTAEGLEPLSNSESIESESQSWSSLMADMGDLTHGDISCRPGAENIALTYYKERIDTADGTVEYTTNEELGKGLAEQWLDSEEHRENIMSSQFRQTGIGLKHVEQDGENVVYATQRFCG